jgi:hypothetical protein
MQKAFCLSNMQDQSCSHLSASVGSKTGANASLQLPCKMNIAAFYQQIRHQETSQSSKQPSTQYPVNRILSEFAEAVF